MNSSTSKRPPTPPSLWPLVAMLTAIVVALIAGILKAGAGAGPADAALTGGMALGVTLALCATVLTAKRWW